MKYLVLLLVSVSIFLLGIIFWLIPLPGSGVLLIIGLAVFVFYAALKYMEKRSPVMRKLLIIFSIALLASLFLAMIRNENFAELILMMVISGLIIFLLTFIAANKKKTSPKDQES